MPRLLASGAGPLAALALALLFGLSACGMVSASARAGHHGGRSSPARVHVASGRRAARHRIAPEQPRPVPTIRPGRGHHGASAACAALTARQVAANNAGVRLLNGCVLSATAAFARTGEAIAGSRNAMYLALAEAGARS